MKMISMLDLLREASGDNVKAVARELEDHGIKIRSLRGSSRLEIVASGRTYILDVVGRK